MPKRLKNILSKLNFIIGRNPKIEKGNDWQKFIPKPFKAVMTITADFELAWAPRYVKDIDNPYKKAIFLARRERENILKILQLCENFNIPITWATVGHLFLKECRCYNGKAHPEIPQIAPYKGKYWDFNGKDWFEYDPCSNYLEAPEWYAPDLIEMILNSNVQHEIGCHTFSHIDCRDEVCTPELFCAEINACKKEASKLGLSLKSFVHPGHTIGNLPQLVELGFTSFQSDTGNILGYPVKHDNGIWEMKRTYEFVWRDGWSLDYHIYRYKKIIDRAIKTNTVCNFWFHPSFDEKFLNKVLPEIFSYLNIHKENIFLSTVDNYISWLQKEIAY
ncbi:polysaccharide deacetylase [Melioribacter sp. OK-6-Me]|uniref:polysaccharide deacetylase n=1 Tax=Melioribacter sp. OK-6-Me TaxID=3423433 RepID=UPI003ED8C71B